MEDPAHQHFKHAVVDQLDAVWRKAFVGKVYTLLALQILLTLVIVFSMVQFGGYDFYIWSLTSGSWTRSISFLATFGILISMMCYKNAYPLNLILLPMTLVEFFLKWQIAMPDSPPQGL